MLEALFLPVWTRLSASVPALLVAWRALLAFVSRMLALLSFALRSFALRPFALERIFALRRPLRCALVLRSESHVGAKEALDEVGAVEASQFRHDAGPFLRFIPEKEEALALFLLRRFRREDRFERVGVETAVPRLRRHRHRRWREVLHLFQAEVEVFRLRCQFGHVFLRAARVGRDEIRDDLLVEARLTVDAVEDGLKLVEEFERGFAHEV